MSVHPRVCGEQATTITDDASIGGSSPRVRGTGRSAHTRDLRCPVHPRVCGEQFDLTAHLLKILGSSPRVRGTVEAGLRNDFATRFIPACAGNRYFELLYPTAVSVHPRVCGEQEGNTEKLLDSKRFIPACAGNSDPPPSKNRSDPVHPRVCGEQKTRAFALRAFRGSSPRVRGTAIRLHPRIDLIRFIPACAGNRRHALLHSGHFAVHPRVCGEQAGDHATPSAAGGSSPRVRGTEWRMAAAITLIRFIPACAGNRPCICTRHFGLTVHPRVCGEQGVYIAAGIGGAGSSPRVRGTGWLWPPSAASVSVHPRVCGEQATTCRDAPSSMRFIPACAGNRPTLQQSAIHKSVHPRVCGEQQ